MTRSIRALLSAALVTGATIAAVLTVRAGTAQGAPATATDAQSRITLLTGEQVRLLPGTGATPQVVVTPGSGRAHIPIVTLHKGGHVYVEPSDARALIATGGLDERLFDVTQLVAWHYDDQHRTTIPVIAQYAQHVRAAALPGVVQRAGVANDMSAMRIGKADAATTWRSLASGDRFSVASGVTRLWLDGQRRPLDDRSRVQIGVPAAEQLGLTGAGVEVAVLDTGYDPSHPDLAGAVNASRGFTDAGPADVTDHFGHGTHVASILAGSGAASGGRYRGIATGARLAIGKVCAGGTCDDSAILAGMSWAATEVHARIVNLSLGGTDTPDVDPIEQAIDTLTAQTGTLFVVAAGNDGPSPATINSPASADAALAVGAVDSTDTLADFSSRGPRTEGGEIKPDITAPGVDIVAARAAGTELGNLVGSDYVKLSGTSMAAPHVAGAAALLAQQHPSWQAQQLKDALMSSAAAAPGGTPYDQGAGRVDVAQAVTAPVTSSPASLSALLAFPHSPGQQLVRTYSYRNDTAAPVALHLVTTAAAGGTPAPAGLLSLSDTDVTVPANGSREVSLTIHGDAAVPALYSGAIEATTANGQVVARTTLLANVEVESYDLQVNALDRAGAPTDTPVLIFDPVAGEFHDLDVVGGHGSLRLPAKTYDLFTVIATEEAAGSSQTLMITPFDLRRGNVDATLDARGGRKVDVRVDTPHSAGVVDMLVLDQGGGGGLAGADIQTDAGLAYAVPTTQQRVSFGVASVWTRAGADAAHPSPYRYDPVTFRAGGIPARPVFHYRKAELAKVVTRYRALAATDFGHLIRMPETVLGPVGFVASDIGLLPATVTDYVTPGQLYTTEFDYGPTPDAFGGDEISIDDSYHPGTQNVLYNAAVLGPSFPYERDDREGDAMIFTAYSFITDVGPGGDRHAGFDPGLTGTVTLRREGRAVGQWPYSETKYVLRGLPPEEATYTLTFSTDRVGTYSNLSTHVDAAWTFRSAGADNTDQLLPLLAVRPEALGLDDSNRAPAGSVTKIPITVIRNPDNGPATVSSLRIESSSDDGRTWQPVTLERTGSGWLARIANPHRPGYVSLRAQASDADGNAVSETIIHAYAVR